MHEIVHPPHCEEATNECNYVSGDMKKQPKKENNEENDLFYLTPVFRKIFDYELYSSQSLDIRVKHQLSNAMYHRTLVYEVC